MLQFRFLFWSLFLELFVSCFLLFDFIFYLFDFFFWTFCLLWLRKNNFWIVPALTYWVSFSHFSEVKLVDNNSFFPFFMLYVFSRITDRKKCVFDIHRLSFFMFSLFDLKSVSYCCFRRLKLLCYYRFAVGSIRFGREGWLWILFMVWRLRWLILGCQFALKRCLTQLHYALT